MVRTENLDRLINQYVDAKDFVIDNGYEREIDWQLGLDFTASTESDFLREGAWVILSSGMRESTIRQKFDAISDAFLDFSSAVEIVEHCDVCRADSLLVFNHHKKIDAILSMSLRVVLDGFQAIKSSTNHYGIKYLRSFDFIGPATSYHLAKNLGLNVPKPDRHLCRVAEVSGFDSVQQLCESISAVTGDPVPVVDLVIWRFATLRADYKLWFTESGPH